MKSRATRCATPSEKKTDPAQPRLRESGQGKEELWKEIKVLKVEKIAQEGGKKKGNDTERDCEVK